MNNSPSLVALVGGEEFSSYCVEMDTRILSLIKPLNGKPKVAIVPTAAAFQRPDLAAENGVKHFRSLGADSYAVNILSKSDAEDDKFIPDLKEANLIYLTGGDPNHLVSVFSDSHILELIGTLTNQGCFLAGSSAGAMVLGNQMFHRKVTTGLSLIGDIITLPHHENSNPASIHRSIVSKLPKDSKVYGIDGGTGLIFTEAKTEILGKGTVTSYSQNGWTVSTSRRTT